MIFYPMQKLFYYVQITKEQLQPAYGGESAGLDLYNAGPDLVIPSAPNIPWPGRLKGMSVQEFFDSKADWNNYPEEDRKKYFKTLMPTGIKVQIPQGHVGLIVERSSIVKTPLKVRAGVIDPGYTGEVFVNMVNLCPAEIVIKAGEKSPFQLLVLRCENRFQLVDEDIYEQNVENSKRLAGAIGSSDAVIANTINTVIM